MGLVLTVKTGLNGDVKFMCAGQFYFEWRPGAREIFVRNNEGALVYQGPAYNVHVGSGEIVVFESPECTEG